jgi:two-component system, OmpR family, alkaline phosphatase synthesis response regulator PhoP
MGDFTKDTKDQSGTIVVIEDDVSLAQLIVYLLSREGFEAVSASDGAEGLEAVRRYRPKIVILDLTLPSMSGDDVCRAIRQDPELRDTFVVVMTALDDREARHRVREAGADCYMCKPFDPARLVDVIDDALRSQPKSQPSGAAL